MSGEIWRRVPSAPFFLASNEGRIMVEPYEAPMPGAQGVRQYGGYPHFGVWNKTDARFAVFHKGKTYKAQLVCEAFNGPRPFPDAVCMHLDENAANNRADNLKWGTQKENLNAPGFIEYCKGRTGKDNPFVKGRSRQEEDA